MTMSVPHAAAAAPPPAREVGGARMSASPAAWTIALAIGVEAAPPEDLDWAATWAIALRERLAMLCWVRHGAVIRRHAPRPIVDAWRRHAIVAEARGRTQLAAIEQVVDALDRVSVSVALLKGRALAALAYGDPASRVSTDIDLFVKLRDRWRAAEVLASLGWRRRAGRPPWDETWERVLDGRTHFLELHSMLVHDTLAHHALPPRRWRRVDIGGVSVRTLGGAELPAYLAAHAAVHDRPALVWFLDLRAIWSAMPPDERAAACAAARRAGLERHLDWAIERAAAIDRAARGSPEALSLLGIGADGFRADRALARSLRLAPGAAAALRVASAWIWPRPLRRSVRGTLALAARRALRFVPGRRGVPHEPTSLATERALPVRALALDRSELCDVVRATVAAGAGVWVAVRGASMAPAIPPGAQVRLGPLPERSLRRGEVVLALLPSGLPVLHRVRELQDDSVVLQGDALPTPDVPVRRSAVIAVAELVRTDADVRAVPRRGRRPWRRIGWWWMHRLARGTTHVD